MEALKNLFRGLVIEPTRLAWLVLFLPVVGILLFAADALARAGGGGNYVGGGGGGFSGGSGGGEGIGALIYLVIAYPEVGIPLVIVVAVIAIVKRVRNPDRRTAKAVKRLEQLGAPDTSGLAAIKERDPGFEDNAFLAKVTKIELAVQDAWTRGDMRPVRTFLSDGLLRRFQTHLSVMRHQGLRNALADHQVIESRIHAVEQDRHFDTIHVAFRAAAKDVEVDASLSLEQALAAAAKARREEWTEIWSFLRRPGTKTLAGGGAVEGYCPNCGGPIELGQATRCDHCQGLINSGDYDWVLAEITQTIEWRPSSTGTVPGLEQLAARDPAFNRQAAEDRASYVFWRWIEARVLGRPGPVAKCASKEFQARIAELVKGGGAALYKTAVGSVDLVACEPGVEGGRDRFHVKLLWSSATSNKAAPSPAANVFSLGRKAGAVDDGSLSHARCPECMGPLGENDSPQCEYCGADLASGDKEWVLENVVRPEELRLSVQPQAPGMAAVGATVAVPVWATPDMGNPRERMLLLMRMAAVVVADGVVTKEERKLLKSASKRWGVPLEAVEPILSGEVAPEAVATMRPSNPSAFLSGLISAALIDGKIDSKEEKLLLDVGRSLGMSDGDTKNYMNAMAKSLKAAG
jgi:hypothetical protein